MSTHYSLPPFARDPSRLHAHHIGGRAGNIVFPCPRLFADDCVLYNYDADPECLVQMEKEMAASGFNGVALEALIGPADGSLPFHVMRDPFTSSLLPGNPAYGNWYSFDDGNGDYIIAEALAVERTLTLSARSLDSLVEDQGIYIDFLSLDVQGAEHALLEGSKNLLNKSILGLYQEASTFELYHGEKTLSVTLAQAQEAGFRVIRFFPRGEWAGVRAPIGWRYRGESIIYDILLLKDPTVVLKSHPDPHLGLYKLAGIAVLYGLVELVLECAEVMSQAGFADLSPPHPERIYQCLVHELWTESAKATCLFPPSFTDLFSVEESTARFGADTSPKDIWTINYKSARQRYFTTYTPTIFLNAVKAACEDSSYGAAGVFRKYGLLRSAEEIHKKTRHHALQSLRMLGLLAREDNFPNWSWIETLLNEEAILAEHQTTPVS